MSDLRSRPSHRTRAGGSLPFVGIALVGLVGAGVLTGCYQRVVSARGPGTEGYTIHDPASDGVVLKRFDRWIMGEPDPVRHKR